MVRRNKHSATGCNEVQEKIKKHFDSNSDFFTFFGSPSPTESIFNEMKNIR